MKTHCNVSREFSQDKSPEIFLHYGLCRGVLLEIFQNFQYDVFMENRPEFSGRVHVIEQPTHFIENYLE